MAEPESSASVDPFHSHGPIYVDPSGNVLEDVAGVSTVESPTPPNITGVRLYEVIRATTIYTVPSRA